MMRDLHVLQRIWIIRSTVGNADDDLCPELRSVRFDVLFPPTIGFGNALLSFFASSMSSTYGLMISSKRIAVGVLPLGRSESNTKVTSRVEVQDVNEWDEFRK